MSSTLKFKKVYIDTKFKTPDSKSTSDFSIELPETMYFDNNSSVFYIDDVCIPHSWYSISENLNDQLYLYVSTPSLNVSYSRIITLAYGIYTPETLAAEIQTKINAATGTLGTDSLTFSCTYKYLTNLLEIKVETSSIGTNGWVFIY